MGDYDLLITQQGKLLQRISRNSKCDLSLINNALEFFSEVCEKSSTL